MSNVLLESTQTLLPLSRAMTASPEGIAQMSRPDSAWNASRVDISQVHLASTALIAVMVTTRAKNRALQRVSSVQLALSRLATALKIVQHAQSDMYL